jgi:SPP1 family predicted phage head-tail adaptor
MLTKDKTTYVGDLKQRVELQSYTTVSDGMGGTTATWVKEADLWANIKPVNGSEKWEIESIKGNISHTVLMRHRAITNENRLVYNGRKFNVKYAIDKGEEGALTKLAVAEEV